MNCITALPDEEEDIYNYRMKSGLRHVDPENAVAENGEVGFQTL